MSVLVTLIKFNGHCNIGNILNGKHSFFFSFFFFVSCMLVSGLILMSLKIYGSCASQLCEFVDCLVLLVYWKQHSELRRKD